ncbi:helix-turn-helix domain-containing protein [Natrialbaceae archaeon A-CW1-1]
MRQIQSLRGTHFALSTITDSERFREWLELNRSGPPEKYFEGYRMLVRVCYHAFQAKLHRSRNQFQIETNTEFERAAAELADIDSLSASSEAAHLIKHIEELDQKLSSAHNFEYLEKVLSTLREHVIDPFESVFSEFGEYAVQEAPKVVDNYLASYSLVTYANDTARGYPEGFQHSWMRSRNSGEEFDQGFDGYKTSLCWAYSVLAPSDTDTTELCQEIAAANGWSELDSTFRTAREILLEPFERRVDNHSGFINLHLSSTPEQIADLLSGAPDPEVNIENRLDRFFLWDFVNRANEPLTGSGISGILVLLFGLQRMRSNIGATQPIRVRRVVHPDQPGNNYSYGIETSGWSLEGAGSLHGWIVFVRRATDYSGFGGRQHKLIEEHLSNLEEKGIVEIVELEVDEEVFEHYLDENRHTPNDHQRDLRQPKFDHRRVNRILRRGEDQRTEFKEKLPEDSFSELGKEIVALANHDGGVLLLGVNDDGEIVGIEEPDRLDNGISGILRTSCKPPLSADIHIESTPKGDILIVDIPDASKPIALNYVYYIRTGRNKEKMLYEEIKQRFE